MAASWLIVIPKILLLMPLAILPAHKPFPICRSIAHIQPIPIVQAKAECTIRNLVPVYRLPSHLQIPPYQEVDRSTLLAINPDLGPIEQVPDLQMLRTIANAEAETVSHSVLPSEMVLTLKDMTDFPAPTHILAIHGRNNPKETPSRYGGYCPDTDSDCPDTDSEYSPDTAAAIVPIRPVTLPSPYRDSSR
ncbi:hypothetical protein B0H11DRAFT_1924020 [Mycena galericulata]|nr:hypothetical protein B0H11DRAFT_1924020 [Mycena galericulata]